MTLLFLFAHIWGIFQLFIVTSPSRTVRLRTLIVAFLSGTFISFPIAFLLGKIYIGALTARSAPLTIDPVFQASITGAPFIEEIAKLIPLLVMR